MISCKNLNVRYNLEQARRRLEQDMANVAVVYGEAVRVELGVSHALFYSGTGYGPAGRTAILRYGTGPNGTWTVVVEALNGPPLRFRRAWGDRWEHVTKGETVFCGNAHGLAHVLAGLVTALHAAAEDEDRNEHTVAAADLPAGPGARREIFFGDAWYPLGVVRAETDGTRVVQVHLKPGLRPTEMYLDPADPVEVRDARPGSVE